MMTLYLLFKAMDRGKLSPSSRMRVSKWAASQPPTKLGLSRGARSWCATPSSARDAVGERRRGGDRRSAGWQRRQVCASHDRQARGLGMERTTFRNASGLHHPQQKTTARDMAVLGRALLRDFPRRYSTFATRTFRACQVDVAAGGELVAPWGHRRRVPDGMAKSRSQAKAAKGGLV
jgi:D-alanyl-D-alanine carboxypeptidase